ncbi:lyase family protein, partial [Marivivens sp.]|uniref:lyase family protein n=1 Tax=Marivivens sp. TaxID=1978374 RepID=UPI00345B7554
MQSLLEELDLLRRAFLAKAGEFDDILQVGRTQLQDAVPMTLGQTFESYAVTTGDDVDRLHQVIELMTEINLGGTAIGTRINASAKYVTEVCKILSELTGV